jgi:molecular chaperone GrpE
MNSKNTRNKVEDDQNRGDSKTAPETPGGGRPAGPPSSAQSPPPGEPLAGAEAVVPVEETHPRKEERAETEELRSLRHKLKKKEHELKSAKKASEDFREKYLRLLAEMENQRKRLEREKSDYFQFALTDVLRELISVVDNFERALKTKDQGDAKSFQEGVELIYRQFLDLIRRLGVTPVETKNEKFDPALHQAVASEESDQVAEPVIGEELLKGYKLNDRLLRPAAVKVLVPKKS